MKSKVSKTGGNIILINAFLIAFSFTACSENGNSIQDDADENQYHLKVDPQTVYQEIDHFGASDAWSGQFVGTWPEPKKGAIADLLFSNNMDEQGNPKGIGLSLWRFNLGAGSTEQGEESGIRDAWRRAPSLVDASGNFKI
ncbi:MAG TPA: glycoside hydrolase, partial [Anditalea sp.]|nr:glycoside hydrolase [Anditalea sp.]